jgi:hypothetical protein
VAAAGGRVGFGTVASSAFAVDDWLPLVRFGSSRLPHPATVRESITRVRIYGV